MTIEGMRDGWFPNSVEDKASTQAEDVEKSSSIFPVEASFELELEHARRRPEAFRKRWIVPAQAELDAWEETTNQAHDAAVGATLHLNVGMRLCALGAANGEVEPVADATDHFRRALETEASAERRDPILAARIQHSLGYSLLNVARAVGDIAGLEASAMASAAAAEAFAAAGELKKGAHANFNRALAYTAQANRTGKVQELQAAASAFADSAAMYIAAAEPQESASALYRQGLILLQLGKRTGSNTTLRQAAAACIEAANRFAAVGDVCASAVALDNQTIALAEAGDLRGASSAAATAATRHEEAGDVLLHAHAKFRQGHALSELARASEGGELLLEAAAALASAERGYVESASELDLASVLHNQGVCLLEFAERTRDADTFHRSAALFARASKSYFAAGSNENGAVAEYYRGVGLLNYAALQEHLPAFRESAQASAAAATIAQQSPDAEKWYANARYNEGTAIFELAKRTNASVDFQEAAATLEDASRCLRNVEHTDRALVAEADRDLALTALRERGERPRVDNTSQSVASTSSTKRGTGKIADVPAAIQTDVRIDEEFASASRAELLQEIERLRALGGGEEQPKGTGFHDAPLSELVATLAEEGDAPPEGLEKRLCEIVQEAQQRPPVDRRGFARDVNALLDGYALRFKLEDGALARLIVSGSSKAGSLQFGVTGGNRSFKKPSIEIIPISLTHRGLEPDL